MTHPIVMATATAAMVMAVYIPSDTWPGYESDDDDNKNNDEYKAMEVVAH